MKKITFTLGLAALLLTSLTSVQASLIAYDGFTTANSSGTGWTGNWSGSYTLGGASLDSGNGLVTSGGSSTGGAYFNSNPGGEPTRLITTPATTGDVWVSWLQESNPNNGDLGQLRFQSGGNMQFVIGQHFDSNIFKIYNPDVDGAVTNSGVAISGTQFVTVRFNLDSKAVSLWINPTGLGTGLTPSSAAAASTAPGGAFSFDTLKFTSQTATFNVDEVRVGTTWADVSPIPEPSTYAMLALGLGAVFFLRRRRTA